MRALNEISAGWAEKARAAGDRPAALWCVASASRSVGKLDAEVDAVGPEARLIELRGGAGLAHDRWGVVTIEGCARAGLSQIDAAVHLVAGPDHAGKEHGIVTGEDAKAACDVDADVELHFGNDGEDVARLSADVGALGEQAPGIAGGEGAKEDRHGIRERAIDVNDLMHPAQGDLAQET